jgi:preprotein translocase subunit YajC
MLQILLQAPAGGGFSNIIFIGAIIIVFYFFMVRPQQKKIRDQKKFRESLTKGARGIRLTFEKSSIASEVTPPIKTT